MRSSRGDEPTASHPGSATASSKETHGEPDYAAIDVPTTKPPADYHYTERRADLLQQVLDVGHPDFLNQTELAERYDVNQSTISRDLSRLADHVRETRVADRDRRAFTVESVVSRSIRGLLDEGEYRKAADVAMKFDEWATERCDVDQLYARLEALED